jgi:hypothetical protein
VPLVKVLLTVEVGIRPVVNLFRVTLRHDLAAEVWHLKEPQKLPPVLSPDEVKRILAMVASLKARVMSSISYGCGPARWCDCGCTTSTVRR